MKLLLLTIITLQKIKAEKITLKLKIIIILTPSFIVNMRLTYFAWHNYLCICLITPEVQKTKSISHQFGYSWD